LAAARGLAAFVAPARAGAFALFALAADFAEAFVATLDTADFDAAAFDTVAFAAVVFRTAPLVFSKVLKLAPAEKRTPFDAGILTSAPVCGLRPFRARRREDAHASGSK
jgi:hypothetical protein